MSERRDIPKLPGVDLRLPQPPFFLIAAFIVVVILTWVPLVLIAKSRVTPSKKPRIHLFQDMDHQPRYGAQQTNTTFPDRRAMRPRVPGTVARGSLETDDHYYRGGVVAVEDGRARALPGAVPRDQRPRASRASGSTAGSSSASSGERQSSGACRCCCTSKPSGAVPAEPWTARCSTRMKS